MATLSQVLNMFRLVSGRRNMSAATISTFIAREYEDLQSQYHFRWMERSDTLTLATGATSIVLPSRWRSFTDLYRLSMQTNPCIAFHYPKMRRITRREAMGRFGNATGSVSCYYVYNDRMYLEPVPKRNYRIRRDYVIALTVPPNSSLTNAFVDKFPEVILYGALRRLPRSLANREDLDDWKREYQEKLTALVKDHAVEHTIDLEQKVNARNDYRAYFRY